MEYVTAILTFVTGLPLEALGGAGLALVGFVFGWRFGRGNKKRDKAEREAAVEKAKNVVLEDHIKTLNEVRHATDAELVDRISGPE